MPGFHHTSADIFKTCILSLCLSERTAAALHLVQQHKTLVPLPAPHSPAHLTNPAPLASLLSCYLLVSVYTLKRCHTGRVQASEP